MSFKDYEENGYGLGCISYSSLFNHLGEMGAELKVSIVGVLTTISRIYFGGCVGVGSS